MAAPGRTHDFDLTRMELQQALQSEPFRFRFFQAVRLLERINPGRQPVGRFFPPATEVVRFTVHQSLAFPASEIQEMEWPDDKAPRMSVNFIGLTGPLGVLPIAYTEMMLERSRLRDHAPAEFFDLFNHRMISLFYQAWEKYRFGIGYERHEHDRMAEYLLDLIGLGTGGLQQRQTNPDESMLFYSGLLSRRVRPALGLEQMLSDYFNVPVEVDQFAGNWYRVSKDTQTQFADGRSQSECLGFGVLVGDEIWDEQAGVRVRIGPLPMKRYLDFLPEGSSYDSLRSMIRFYFNDELDFQVQLVLKREDTPACELGNEDPAAPRLGWVTWVKTSPMKRDPGETILRI